MFDEFEREIGQAVVLADFEDLHNVRMLQPRHQFRLAVQLPAFVILQPWCFAENLDGHQAVQRMLACPVNHSRSAAPDLFQQRVTSGLIRAILAVPLTVKEQVIGALGLVDVSGRVFTEDDVRAAAHKAQAHEFIIKPAQLHFESGAKMAFNIMATHFFFVGEEVEPLDTVKAWLIEGDEGTLIGIKENHILETLDGAAAANRKGTAILADGRAHIKITNPGTWMVRVEKRLDVNHPDYNIQALKATLVFSIN